MTQLTRGKHYFLARTPLSLLSGREQSYGALGRASHTGKSALANDLEEIGERLERNDLWSKTDHIIVVV